MMASGCRFDESEVLDTIPYTSYRLPALTKAEPERSDIFESKKARLVRNKTSLIRQDYAGYLAGLRAQPAPTEPKRSDGWI